VVIDDNDDGADENDHYVAGPSRVVVLAELDINDGKMIFININTI